MPPLLIYERFRAAIWQKIQLQVNPGNFQELESLSLQEKYMAECK